MIIGLCGLAGSGKNAVGTILRRNHDFGLIAFADPIYDAVAAITGINRRELEDRRLKERPIPWLGKSPRQLLQTLGTEWGRETVCQDIWIKTAMRAAAAYDRVAITDVRFDNEAEAVRSAGGVVWQVRRIAAGLAGGAGSHPSEAGIRADLVDEVIHNSGDIYDLEDLVEETWHRRQNATMNRTDP